MTNAGELREAFGFHDRFRIEGDRYVYEVPSMDVTLALSRVEFSKSNVYGLLTAVHQNGSGPITMYPRRFNLVGERSVPSMAKYLEGLFNVGDLRQPLEELCGKTLTALDESAPTVIVGVGAMPEQPSHLLHPVILRDDRTLMYAADGSGKTTLAVLFAAAIEMGYDVAGMTATEQRRVLYCDWEDDLYRFRRKLDAIARGFGIYEHSPECPNLCVYPHVRYKQCLVPLIDLSSQIEREVQQDDIGLVIVDSLSYAAHGSINDDDVIRPMTSAMRRWRTSVLINDHEGKDAERGIVGNRFKRNAARLVWRVQAGSTGAEHVMLTSEKASFVRRSRQLGFRFGYYLGGIPTQDGEEADEIRVERENPREQPEQRPNLNDTQRIYQTLREARESLTREQITERSGVKEDTAKSRLNEMKNAGSVVFIDTKGMARKYALASARREDE